MAILKCKMCGAPLYTSGSATVVECDYCESRQTISLLDDEKIIELYERANQYRSLNEFDKASVIYDNILLEKPSEAEAHWGICLCRYGIEYVQDPKTGKRVPTCHRTQFKSILDDPDYLAAIHHADVFARDVYKEEAEYIDTVQKSILSISSKEEPFDIFICYKESDQFGNRTIDSVLAQDIYDKLTSVGYKVFFARITLENKLGSAYEPYIFAALSSAKIMLVVGTKPEHFEAVWVKNEWSRYLSLMGQGHEKTIIPCYRDMSPYELPQEFVVLQSLDMNKIGAMQDLAHGVKKILPLQNAQEQSAPYSAPFNYTADVPLPIQTVQAKGAMHQNDFWPAGNSTSIINKNRFPVISFQIYLLAPCNINGTVTVGFKIYDEMNHLVCNNNNVVAVQPHNDRFAQTWILNGLDGSSVPAGRYKAIFTLNNGVPYTFNFRVADNSEPNFHTSSTSNDALKAAAINPASLGTTLNNQTKDKSFALYLILCLFFGSWGLHSFYADNKTKGLIQLILTVTSILAIVSFIWAISDFVKAIKYKKIPD